MGDKHTLACKGKEELKSLSLLWRARNVLIGNRGKPCNLLGNGTFGVNKDVEFINNLTFLDLNRTDLNDLACAVGKTGRLNIENDHLI